MNRDDIVAKDATEDLSLDHRKRSRSMTSIEMNVQMSALCTKDLHSSLVQGAHADSGRLRLVILGVAGNKVVMAVYFGGLRLKDKILEEGDIWDVDLSSS